MIKMNEEITAGLAALKGWVCGMLVLQHSTGSGLDLIAEMVGTIRDLSMQLMERRKTAGWIPRAERRSPRGQIQGEVMHSSSGGGIRTLPYMR